MPHYRYLIIGGGMTADAAVQAIRAGRPDSSIGLISAETVPPYNRPPLTKGLWQGDPINVIWRETEDLDVDFHLGRKAQHLDAGQRLVVDDQGTEYTYERLLLATGGTARRLPFDEDYDNERIIYFRTLADYERLRALTQVGQRFAVVGGGFIGSELAAALTMNDKEVVMIFPEAGIGANRFPSDLAGFLNNYYAQKGVEVLANHTVLNLETQGDQLALYTQQGEEVMVDGMVAGLGIEPNVYLAEAAGLEVANGIVVDEFLRTSNPAIYAAGDVASFYNPALNMRLRVEHEDNANTMGQMVGRAMAGDPVPYNHLPFFYSDLFDLGYEAVGDLNNELGIVADWETPYEKGVVYYMKDGRVRGVLLWNVWEQVDMARELIAEPGPFEPKDLKKRLPA